MTKFDRRKLTSYMIVFLLSLSPRYSFKKIFVFSEMHCGKTQVGSTSNLCPRFKPESPELNSGLISNLGSDIYKGFDQKSGNWKNPRLSIAQYLHVNKKQKRDVPIIGRSYSFSTVKTRKKYQGI